MNEMSPHISIDRDAVVHLIQTIGEAARQVSREFCENHPDVRWADIIGIGRRY